jgi:CRISPR system Cascade subunit CasA
MQPFHLLHDAWIPVRWMTSWPAKPGLVSLRQVFRDANRIEDLDGAPAERIALTRLLVAITHAACGSPAERDDWATFRTSPSDIDAYLLREDVAPHFQLFGEGPRFLQRPAGEGGFTQPFTKLFPELASGSNSTLLDHWGELPRPWVPARLALGVLCIQNFFVGGSMGRFVQGNGPALNMLHSILLGASLAETIRLNCLDRETGPREFGLPSWHGECSGSERVAWLHRLTPVPCRLWLDPENATVTIAQGVRYAEFEEFREPAASVRRVDDERRLLRASPARAIWRDLHTLTALQPDAGGFQNTAMVIQSHSRELAGSPTIRLWTGELIKAKDAKIVDAVESSLSIPWAMFEPPARNAYRAGVEHADHVANRRLYGAVKRYWDALKHDGAPVDAARNHYWHALDQCSGILLADAKLDPALRAGRPGYGERGAGDAWTRVVARAARDAYEQTCPRETPRQLQAFAAGVKLLPFFPVPSLTESLHPIHDHA